MEPRERYPPIRLPPFFPICLTLPKIGPNTPHYGDNLNEFALLIWPTLIV